MNQFNRITYSPYILGGQACIRGMRISVQLILNLLANDMEKQDILQEYPDLEPEDISQCLKYAAFLAEEKVFAVA